MTTYHLDVYCRKDGISRDRGRHATCKAKDLTDALKKLMRTTSILLQHYDTVQCTIRDDAGATLHRFRLP